MMLAIKVVMPFSPVIAALPEGVTVALISGGVAVISSIVGALGAKWYDNRRQSKEKQQDDAATVRTREIEDAAATRAELWSEIRSLRNRTVEITTAHDNLVRDAANHAAEVRFLSQQVRYLSETLRTTSEQREQLQKRLQELERENQNLHAQLDTMQRQNNQLEDQVAHLQKSLEIIQGGEKAS